MQAEEIIQKMRIAGIGCDEDRIRREWHMNMSQATDEYMAAGEVGRRGISNAAIRQVPCTFCEAEAGQACSLRVPYDKGLDGFCHTGRWMKYLIERNSLDDLFGPPPLVGWVDEAKQVAKELASSDDLSDLIG